MAVANTRTYTTMWTNDRCRALVKAGRAGDRLEVLFGGPHLTMPRFSRAVRPGDRVVPIRLHSGTLYVLGCLEAVRVVPYDPDDTDGREVRPAAVTDEEYAMLRR